jgi:hypothetical protein
MFLTIVTHKKTGHLVTLNFKDNRIKVIFRNTNRGVGAAVISGYE